MAAQAATSASVVVVDAKSVAEYRDHAVKEMLEHDARQPPSIIGLSGIAYTVPYAVTVVSFRGASAEEKQRVASIVETAFNLCNTHLNEFNANSEVSAVNRLPVGTPAKMSPLFAKVIDAAHRVSGTSGGAFDIALAPIAEFLTALAVKRGGSLRAVPPTELAALTAPFATFSSFYNGFVVDPKAGTIARKNPSARLFLGALSKGATVDLIVDELVAAGFSNCLVDWGGDMKGMGVNHHGAPWRVGILAPPTIDQLKAGDNQSYRDEKTRRFIRMCTLENEALATSGDYENLVAKGSLTTKIFHNKSGRLIEAGDHELAQVTIKSTSCLVADALATAALIKREFRLARWFVESWRYRRDAATDFTFYIRSGEKMAIMHEVARESNALKAARIATSIPARVVVIGGGLAGCAAAIEAAKCGASVVLLEKADRIGGNSAKATSGMNGWGTTFQGNRNIEDDGRFFERDTHLSGSGGTSDTGLVRTLSVKSAEAVSWVTKETGLQLSVISQLGGHCRPRTHRVPDLADGTPVPVGYSIMQALARRINETYKGKITILTRVAATELLNVRSDMHDGSSRIRVNGVEYLDLATNTRIRLPADAVILATGGFGNDHTPSSLLREFAPDLEKTPTTNGDFATGDGVKMARAIGASLIDMDKIQLHPTGLVDPNAPNAQTKYLGPEALRGSGGILINRRGQRFTDELGLRSVVSKAIEDQKDIFPGSNECRYAACVLNSAAVKLFGPNQLGFYKDRLKLFKDAATVADLATIIGCPEATLRETLTTYGASCTRGSCPTTGKLVFPCKLDAEGPFVVAFVTPSIHYTMGGVAISPSAEVQMVDTAKAHGELFGRRRPVLGLFGAGEVTAGVHGANRLGGNSLLECVVFGRIAGDRAATILQRSETALSEMEWTPVVVREVREGTSFGRGSIVIRFNFPGALQMSGLKLGQFVSIKGEWDGQQLVGYYSPITLPNEAGVVGLLARKDKGALSEWLSALRPGDAVMMKACPGIEIKRIPEKKELNFEGTAIRRFGFIAGGTGIAPMLQVLRAATKPPFADNVTSLRLIYAAESEDELTYEKIMLDIEDSSSGKFKCHFVINNPPPGWTRGVGFIDGPMLRQWMPPPGDDLLILICGPPVMQNIVKRLLTAQGHNPKLVRTVDDSHPATPPPPPAKL
jgi:flavocytochrome c